MENIPQHPGMELRQIISGLKISPAQFAKEVDVSPSGQRVAQVRNAFACKGACRAGFGRTTARSSSVGH